MRLLSFHWVNQQYNLSSTNFLLYKCSDGSDRHLLFIYYFDLAWSQIPGTLIYNVRLHNSWEYPVRVYLLLNIFWRRRNPLTFSFFYNTHTDLDYSSTWTTSRWNWETRSHFRMSLKSTFPRFSHNCSSSDALQTGIYTLRIWLIPTHRARMLFSRTQVSNNACRPISSFPQCLMHREVGMTHMLPALCMNSSVPEFLTITIWLPTQPFLEELHSSRKNTSPYQGRCYRS